MHIGAQDAIENWWNSRSTLSLITDADQRIQEQLWHEIPRLISPLQLRLRRLAAAIDIDGELASVDRINRLLARQDAVGNRYLRDRHKIHVPDTVRVTGSVSHGWWQKQQFGDGSG